MPDLRDDGTRFDVVGIGNALVDVLSHEDESFIEAMALTKGAMSLIDTPRAEELYAAMGPGIEASGGSAANTMAGIASFGGPSAYLGKVFDDQLGTVFAHDMRASGVAFSSKPVTTGPPTGRSLIIVTPDAERTMNTFLGASEFFGPEDVDAEVVGAGRITYLEGYLFDRTEAGEAYRLASRIAHEAGRQVALTLSDTFCVERHIGEWRSLVTDAVDILFANEAELRTLYGTDLETAIAQVRRDVALSCVTMGAQGSMLVTAEEIVEVKAEPVADVVDTTGAGDQYAAGVLYGLTQGFALAECGRLGSAAAAEVISHIGARPAESLAQMVR